MELPFPMGPSGSLVQKWCCSSPLPQVPGVIAGGPSALSWKPQAIATFSPSPWVHQPHQHGRGDMTALEEPENY